MKAWFSNINLLGPTLTGTHMWKQDSHVWCTIFLVLRILVSGSEFRAFSSFNWAAKNCNLGKNATKAKSWVCVCICIFRCPPAPKRGVLPPLDGEDFFVFGRWSASMCVHVHSFGPASPFGQKCKFFSHRHLKIGCQKFLHFAISKPGNFVWGKCIQDRSVGWPANRPPSPPCCHPARQMDWHGLQGGHWLVQRRGYFLTRTLKL